MTAAASDTSRSTATSNEDLVVAIALDMLAAKGWLEDDADPELLAALHRLYRERADRASGSRGHVRHGDLRSCLVLAAVGLANHDLRRT